VILPVFLRSIFSKVATVIDSALALPFAEGDSPALEEEELAIGEEVLLLALGDSVPSLSLEEELAIGEEVLLLALGDSVPSLSLEEELAIGEEVLLLALGDSAPS